MIDPNRPPMTPADFKAAMRKIADIDGEDPEVAHCKSDALMMRVLYSLGYGDGCDIFEEMTRWYA